MKVECWFDGSCEPINPEGHTSYGALVKIEGKIALEESGYVGAGPGMTNNVGEYAGMIAVLKYLIENRITEGVIFGDSKLVIYQLDRRMKAKRGCYLPYFREAMSLRQQVPQVRLKWIPRENNTHADWLSRQAIKTAPRAPSRADRIKELIKEQRADMHGTRFRFVQ